MPDDVSLKGLMGSSPLARGLLEDWLRDYYGRRIIPARAGFTVREGPDGRSMGDHPRSRGVYASPSR